MKTSWDSSVVSSNIPLDDLRGIQGSGSTNIKNYCIAGHFTSSPTSQTKITTVVLDTLDKAISSGTRKRTKACERKRRFCVEFIKLIGKTGERRISQKTLNQLAGYEPDDFPKTIRRYKKFLQDAVILKPGSYQAILRGKQVASTSSRIG